MKVAVIGGGISGLGAAVILNQNHEVHLFESATRLGGHAHTVEIQEDNGATIPMDTGFLVFNELTYPHLTAFFQYLNVKTVNSDMSLSIRSKDRRLEWSGTNLNSIFGQRKNLLRPSFYLMLFDILRFHRKAQTDLERARRHGWTLQDLLREGKYSNMFATQYLLPIGAAIWSTPERQMLGYPADTFLNFFINHKLLQVNDRPIWKTVEGGSVNYVKKAQALISNLHLNDAVLAVERKSDTVIVKSHRMEAQFEAVVMATPAPVTLRLLKNPSEQERSVLSAIGVEANRGILHCDGSQMPLTKRCWSAWNVISGRDSGVGLTYHLNRLQPLKTERSYFLSLNSKDEVKDQLGSFDYNHPRFNREAIRAQSKIQSLQGRGGLYFAGAWTRYGFHEDGLRSAVQVAERLGCQAPWQIT